jgi:glycosyltransferase involved in cell wall biosynthesis
MQCGVPVITTNVSSLPEVVGDAGVLVELNQPDQLADSIGELLTDETKRQHYSKAGIQRAKQFSWERTARETKEIYKAVAGKV